MEETLFAFGLVIVAVGVAVVLRLRRSSREASAEIAALQKKIAALEQRARELERAKGQTKEGASDRSFRVEVPAHPKMRSDMWPSMSPSDAPELMVHLWQHIQSQKEVDEAFNRLNLMKAQLPFDTTVKEKYIAELDNIVDRLERASGRDLSRWLGFSPQEEQPGAAPHGQKPEASNARARSRDRTFFRLKILSLLAFCAYLRHHPQLPKGFIPTPPRAARLIH